MMEATRTSETLVNFYQTTRRYNPEDSHLLINAVSTSNATLFLMIVGPKTEVFQTTRIDIVSVIIGTDTVKMAPDFKLGINSWIGYNTEIYETTKGSVCGRQRIQKYGEALRKRPLGRRRKGWGDNVTTRIREIGCLDGSYSGSRPMGFFTNGIQFRGLLPESFIITSANQLLLQNPHSYFYLRMY
jgi:hypothetical protein